MESTVRGSSPLIVLVALCAPPLPAIAQEAGGFRDTTDGEPEASGPPAIEAVPVAVACDPEGRASDWRTVARWNVAARDVRIDYRNEAYDESAAMFPRSVAVQGEDGTRVEVLAWDDECSSSFALHTVTSTRFAITSQCCDEGGEGGGCSIIVAALVEWDEASATARAVETYRSGSGSAPRWTRARPPRAALRAIEERASIAADRLDLAEADRLVTRLLLGGATREAARVHARLTDAQRRVQAADAACRPIVEHLTRIPTWIASLSGDAMTFDPSGEFRMYNAAERALTRILWSCTAGRIAVQVPGVAESLMSFRVEFDPGPFSYGREGLYLIRGTEGRQTFLECAREDLCFGPIEVVRARR